MIKTTLRTRFDAEIGTPPDLAPHPATVVDVSSPARLHLGFLDPSASLGRRFASLGLVLDGFATRLRLQFAEGDSDPAGATATGLGHGLHQRIRIDDRCSGDAAERIARYLATLQRESGLAQPLQVMLSAMPPAHSGFGSGTQLALALGRAFCTLHGLDWSTRRIATVLGRGERSGVGIAGFDQGGLLLDGGPGPDGAAAPLLARVAFPVDWRVVLVLDDRIDGLSGSAERVAMDKLQPFPREFAADLCHQVLMRVLPGAIERRFEPFAAGVSAIQRLIGDYFAPAQGGSMYTSAAVARVIEWIGSHYAAGIGQSSWGPTGFAFLRSADEAAGAIAAARAAGVVDPALRLVVMGTNNRGARVEVATAALARA